MMRDKAHVVDPLDQSARARRDELGPEERKQFEEALAGSALLQTAHEVGQSFDRAGIVRAGDHALIERAAMGALAHGRGRPKRGGVRLTLGLAAAFAAASAAAATVVVTTRQSPEAQAVRPLEAAGVRAPAPPSTKGHARAAGEESEAPAATTPPPRTDSHPARPRAASGSGAPAKQDESASELFREASAARRAGDFALAQALYGELQSRHPGTSEAHVSQVSLGKLLLGAGRPREAALAFGAYLRGGAGDLAEEALVGRANALAALGESGEERRAWQELLEKYPASVYRARAETRVKALDSGSQRVHE